MYASTTKELLPGNISKYTAVGKIGLFQFSRGYLLLHFLFASKNKYQKYSEVTLQETSHGSSCHLIPKLIKLCNHDHYKTKDHFHHYIICNIVH